MYIYIYIYIYTHEYVYLSLSPCISLSLYIYTLCLSQRSPRQGGDGGGAFESATCKSSGYQARWEFMCVYIYIYIYTHVYLHTHMYTLAAPKMLNTETLSCGAAHAYNINTRRTVGVENL